MTDQQKTVLRNIFYAVETGGNEYGKKDYKCFKEPARGKETAITIGAGQWHGVNAKNLLLLIRQTDPELFVSLDTAGIGADLALDWSAYVKAAGSVAAICIQSIIGSPVGIQCQDQKMLLDIQNYINTAAAMGITFLDAQMMCANFIHHGGTGAARRILAKTNEPYTLDRLYEATKSDTGNQVGTYRTRQDMVYRSLKQYITPEAETTKPPSAEAAIERILEIAQEEVGYLEKAGDKDLYDKTANAGTGNYTKYWAELKADFQKQPWCAVFVTWVFEQAFGRDTAEQMLKVGYPWTYVDSLRSYAGGNPPKAGDIVLFWKSDKNRYGHTGIVVEVANENTFYAIEGNTSGKVELDHEVVAEGNGVFCKKRDIKIVPDSKGIVETLFFTPDYSLVQNLENKHKSGWVKEGGGCRFYLGDTGNYVQNDWYQDADNWYWFDGNGMMVSDTWKLGSDSRWYYLAADGRMAREEWVIWKKELYYLTKDGSMFEGDLSLMSNQKGALQITG